MRPGALPGLLPSWGRILKKRCSLLPSVLALTVVPPCAAQAAPREDATGEREEAGPTPGEAPGEPADEILVVGLRDVQRTSIEAKRTALLISDGLVGEEIGLLPDNSVADALERIPGVAADRFKGNANDLSIRGLGPTLSFATFNGREVSNGGPDRSVSFQQFPAELVSGVTVYKSQQADLPEGGVAGVVALESLRPLDFGKRLLRAELRADYQPRASDVTGRSGLGYRANLAFSDVFETAAGQFGLALGYQRQDTSAPEDYYTSTASFVPCNTYAADPFAVGGSPAEQVAAGSNQTCALAATPRNVEGQAVGETLGPTYFANSTRVFRALRTRERRDAAIGALQWRPDPDLTLSLDAQYALRASREERNNLAISEGLRAIRPLVVGTGANGYSPGALISYRGNSYVENQLEDRTRTEQYIGGGFGAEWAPGDWTIAFDGSYSQSRRKERQRQTRLRSTDRVGYTLTFVDGEPVPQVVFEDFDVTDPASFLNTAANSAYARNRFATDRLDWIAAGRLDVTRRLDAGPLRVVAFGLRYSQHRRTSDNARNADLNVLAPLGGLSPAQLIAAGNAACRAPFTTSSFMRGHDPAFTRWTSFDNDCLFRTFTGSDDALPYPDDSRDPSDIDVRERIWAAYAMASFEGDLGAVPVAGNLGLRWVDTRVSSRGYRQPVVITLDPGSDRYSVDVDPAGAPLPTRGRGAYRYALPSANLALDLAPRLKLRLAAYRALARSGIEDLGTGIALSPSAGTGTDSILLNATAGNPDLKPVRAWNADVSLEWYPSPDTVVAVAGYAKWLTGVVIGGTAARPTAITVTTRSTEPGVLESTGTVEIAPVVPVNDPRRRWLRGVEASASHAFTWLPAPLDGLGVSATAARTASNIAFPDTSPIGPYVAPAPLFGLSKWIASGSVWYERDRLSLRASYTYRSAYFKPNSGSNRTVRGYGSLDLAAQFALTRSLVLKLQALNLNGADDIFTKGGNDGIAEVSNLGAQYFLGLSARL